MLGQTFSKCFLVIDYQWNKRYITAILCENRDKPALKCEGKCYLSKKFRKEATKDRENPERRAENKFEVLSFQHGFSMDHPDRPALSLAYPRFRETISNRFADSFFHPPRC
jgi:hypothetical protein